MHHAIAQHFLQHDGAVEHGLQFGRREARGPPVGGDAGVAAVLAKQHRADVPDDAVGAHRARYRNIRITAAAGSAYVHVEDYYADVVRAFAAIRRDLPARLVLIGDGPDREHALAVAADLGARTIREEIDAMEVLGINPIQRLVVPRVLAMILVAILLNGLVAVIGIAGGYFFNVVVQGGTPGAYLASFGSLAQLPDLYISTVKAAIFGVIAGVVAAYKGLNPKGGPKGVGDAVNQSVVITFLLLFFANLILTAVYLQVVPPKGA